MTTPKATIRKGKVITVLPRLTTGTWALRVVLRSPQETVRGGPWKLRVGR